MCLLITEISETLPLLIKSPSSLLQALKAERSGVDSRKDEASSALLNSLGVQYL